MSSYTYKPSFHPNVLDWSRYSDNGAFKLAVCSFTIDFVNTVSVLRYTPKSTSPGNPVDLSDSAFKQTLSWEHPYPPTKCMFSPTPPNESGDLLVTSGDFIRLWSVTETGQRNRAVLNSTHKDYCAPVTSFDWNKVDKHMIASSSLDNTCTLWDLEKLTPTTQLVAHDTEVYDISFSHSQSIFSTVGRDGSLRNFDTRNMEVSTILYEVPSYSPLLRLQYSHSEAHLIAILDSNYNLAVIDVRNPSTPIFTQSQCYAFAWSPNDSRLAIAGPNDVKLCDVHNTESRTVLWRGVADVLNWSPAHPGMITLCTPSAVQVLSV